MIPCALYHWFSDPQYPLVVSVFLPRKRDRVRCIPVLFRRAERAGYRGEAVVNLVCHILQVSRRTVMVHRRKKSNLHRLQRII